MIRTLLLGVTLAAIAPFTPFGCPSGGAPADNDASFQRGVIETTASVSPETADAGETVTLSASADDSAGTVYYAWIQTAGAGVQLVSPQQASTSFSAPSVGSDTTLTFMATTRNDLGDAGRATVSLTVLEDPNYQGDDDEDNTLDGPNADAGTDRSVSPGVQVVLDGSQSSGRFISYNWQQLTGPAVTLNGASTVWARFNAPDYIEGNSDLDFDLTVTDDQGRTDTDTVTITILDPDVTRPRVRIETTLGNIVVELNAEEAPITVENFLQYVDDDFYDGTIFHRVIPDFVIQGGGYLPGLVEQDGLRDPIVNEADNGLSNLRGTIAMARQNDPDTATSQFFINHADNTDLDPGGITPDGYAVFGEVIQGLDVVDQIAAVETTTVEGFQDVPVNDIIIERIVRISASGGSGSSGSPDTGDDNSGSPSIQ